MSNAIEIGNILTISNNKEFLIIDIADYNGEKYIHTVEIGADEKPIDNFEIFIVEHKNGDDYLIELDDVKLKNNLKEYFMHVAAMKTMDAFDLLAGCNI